MSLAPAPCQSRIIGAATETIYESFQGEMLNQMDAGALAQWRSHTRAQTNGEVGAAYVNGKCVCVKNPQGFQSIINPAKQVLGQAQKAPHNQDNIGVFQDTLQRQYLWLFIPLSFSFFCAKDLNRIEPLHLNLNSIESTPRQGHIMLNEPISASHLRNCSQLMGAFKSVKSLCCVKLLIKKKKCL